MTLIKNYINKQAEQISGRIGLFLIAVISWACEHNILPTNEAVTEA